MTRQEQERAVCAVICRSSGIKAREIAERLGLDRKTVNQLLYSSPLMKELCWQDRDFCWHGLVRQARPHIGLQEFAGYYGNVSDFLDLTEEQWLNTLTEVCTNIGRNLNDTRGLFHSFRDARETMVHLFQDLKSFGYPYELMKNWEIVFELRIKKSRYIRIYADVLLITKRFVFSLEFKMKDQIEPEEVTQCAKYCEYLDVIFGDDYEIVPVLVLTRARELYEDAVVGGTDAAIQVASGDMLYNVLDYYLGFLQ